MRDRIKDLRVEGISLVDNYRSQFARVVSKKSFDPLLQDLVAIGAFACTRNEDDIMTHAEGRIGGSRSAHIDDVSTAPVRARLHDTNIAQNAGLAVADETHRIQRAWKVSAS